MENGIKRPEMMKWTVLILLLAAITRSSYACKGYTLKLIHVKDCADNNSVVKGLKGYTASFDNDCNVVLKGCAESSKLVKIAKGKYTLNKPPLPTIEGEIDICNAMTSATLPQIAQVIDAMALPKKCPIPAKKYCATGDKKISLGNFKNQLGMAVGTTDVKLDVDHGDGRSCVMIRITISKG